MEVLIEPTSELIELLSATGKNQSPNNTMTVAQICKATGFSEKKVRRTLRDLIDQGLVECVAVYVKAIHGCDVRSNGYRVVSNQD